MDLDSASSRSFQAKAAFDARECAAATRAGIARHKRQPLSRSSKKPPTGQSAVAREVPKFDLDGDFLSPHALEASEHHDLADDQFDVLDTATSVQADDARVPTTPIAEGRPDTATESPASQSQAGVVTNSQDKHLPLPQKPEKSDDAETVHPLREMPEGKNYDINGGGAHALHAGVHNYAVDVGHGGHSRMHFGDAYTINYNTGDKSYRTKEKLGIDFSLSIQDVSARGLSPGDVSTFKKRTLYVSKRQQPFRADMSHLGVYTSYAKIGRCSLRFPLLRIARLFLRLDRLFAAMFVHIAQEYDRTDLLDLLSQIRGEITRKQPHDSNANNDRDVNFLGDLGHHCEALLRQKSHSDTVAKTEGDFPPNWPLEILPPNQDEIDHESQFEVSHGTEESLLRYLQDGLEIPYWKIMLDAFSAFRANKTTLGTDMVSLSLKSLRFKARLIRHEVQRIVDESQGDENGMEGILCGVDKRIEILGSFADGIISNSDEDDELFEQMLSMPIGAFERRRLLEVAATATIVDKDKEEQQASGVSGKRTPRLTYHPTNNAPQPSSPADLLVLVPLVLLTLMLAIVPFVLGYTRSNSKGTVQDADFWYNISSNIFTIMTNLVMIIQLTHGSRSSKNHLFTWMWFALGILCAIASVAIYPFCSTAWSSLTSFFATIAGFGATLSVAMTVGGSSSRSDEPAPSSPSKRKVE